MHFALNRAAVQVCWGNAHLYELQISIGVTAVTQACCEPALHSNSEQSGMHFAKTAAAVRWC